MSRLNNYMNEALCRHIEKHEKKLNFTDLSIHPQLTLRVLKRYPDRDWNWERIHKNVNFSWDWVDAFPNQKWNWNAFSKHEKFEMSLLKKYPDKDWDWFHLSRLIKKDTLLQYAHKGLDWLYLTLADEFNVEFIMEHRTLPWVINDLFFVAIEDREICFLRVFRNYYNDVDWNDHTRHCSWEYIKKNMDLPWDKSVIRIVPYEDGDLKIIDDNPGEWNRFFLSYDIPVDVILQNPTLDWNYKTGVSLNKSLTYKHVEEHPEIDWNYNWTPVNPCMNEWFASNIIKKYWKHVVTNPAFQVCRNVFMNKMEDVNAQLYHRKITKLQT